MNLPEYEVPNPKTMERLNIFLLCVIVGGFSFLVRDWMAKNEEIMVVGCYPPTKCFLETKNGVKRVIVNVQECPKKGKENKNADAP